MARSTNVAPSWWNNDRWGTPQPFVDQLAHRFATSADPRRSVRAFDLDPCASRNTAKCRRFYTRADNGLVLPWDGSVFFNPPHSETGVWVWRALRQVRRGICPIAVGLLPASIATNWFHKYVLPFAEIHFIHGRIAFLDWNGEPQTQTRGEHFVAVWRPALTPTIYNSLVFPANP